MRMERFFEDLCALDQPVIDGSNFPKKSIHEVSEKHI
jgi:hypothetical protein